MSTEVVHRLGALVCGALVLGWLVRALGAMRRERRVRSRLAELLALERAPARRRFEVRGVGRRWLPVAGAVCVGWVLVGGLVGAGAGLVAGLGVCRWRQRRKPGPVEEYDAARATRQLPLAADLVAACIAAGADPVVAARAVGEALGGPVGARLARGAAEVRLGGEPTEAWRSLASMSGAGALARLLERAGESGVPAAVPVGRLAAEARAEWGRAATARARRAAVMVTVPVGLCFLPAFIAIGVLPVVIGLADGVLGGAG
ncbi:type II secretion system F family protein [Streptomyces sp. NBC_01136]|uniref:type II secretion system F family protein n=1 Tax=unclassified Streptomyces TaxID=2593676 RepID=UPI003244ADA8|nr:type II secretion system F family protein [Streptomyces sp. NBC_01136]